MIQAVALPPAGSPTVSILTVTDTFIAHSRTPHNFLFPSNQGFNSQCLAYCTPRILVKCICCSGISFSGYAGSKHVRRQANVEKWRSCGYRADENAYAVKEATDEDFEKQLQEENIRVLAAVRSRYNDITVLEIDREADHLLAGARILLLDNPGCIHSVFYGHKVLTNSYYDVLATIAPLLPDGPVGLLGLGAGAAAHILHHFYPTLEMHGWEYDPDIITVARQFFNLLELEESEAPRLDSLVSTEADVENRSESSVDQEASVIQDQLKSHRNSGRLTVHIGDALDSNACVEGGFAGLIIDLFAEGRVIPALQEPRTWEQLKGKLRPGGRIIVNCGGDRPSVKEETKSDSQINMEETLAAMEEVFTGELSRRYLARKGFNTLAITGPFPNPQAWTEALPVLLRDGVHEWEPVS